MRTETIIAGLVCASTVFAAPFTQLRRERRAARVRQSQPLRNTTGSAKVDGLATGANTNAQYSDNWAGAVLIGDGYTSVTGSIVVPTPKTPEGGDGSTQYAASAWVGIDGDTCETAILQTGVDFYIQDGQPSYDAWYEWYPAASYTFDNFNLAAGDTIEMTVTATSAKSGKAVLTNQSTGQSVSHSFSSESDSLCQTNAEWIVEDFSNGYSEVPFADFDTVTFTGATAESDGATVDTSGATIINMKQNSQVLTSCSAEGSEVSCTYE